MLVEYRCAMQRRNTYRRREGNVYKCAVAIAIIFHLHIDILIAAPASYDNLLPSQPGEIAEYYTDISGCYYNFQRYEEGDRIVTNEPCLNCTCHNRMLMCYLRVCPFTKAIGQDCTIEKKPDQCCPVITCPEVPVKLLTSSTTSSPTPTTPTTEIGFHDDYGCSIHNSFYADGAQVPSDPRKPCELCYCIRNRTACVMQQCTLHVEGCKPVFQDGVCCPVRYDCDYEKDSTSTTHSQINNNTVIKSTTYSSVIDCQFGNQSYSDGELIITDKPCEHCYCMRGDIVCAVQDCGEPLRGKDCVPTMPPPERCCPSSYDCTNDTLSTPTDGITKNPEITSSPFSTKYTMSESFTKESDRTPVTLTQEQIYEKLGETNRSSPTPLPTNNVSQRLPAKHPSEDILEDNNSHIDADEHFSTTSHEKDYSTSLPQSPVTNTSIPIREILATDKPSYSEFSTVSKLPLSLSTLQLDMLSTTLRVEENTETVTVEAVKTTIPTSDSRLSSPVQPVHDGPILATDTPVTDYTTKSPPETTKFVSNEIYEKVTEVVTQNLSSAGEVMSDNATEKLYDTSLATSGLATTLESKPTVDNQMQDDPTSELNRYATTIREFYGDTAVTKEQPVTNYVQEYVTTSKISHPDEGVTENINTVSDKNTEPIGSESSISSKLPEPTTIETTVKYLSPSGQLKPDLQTEKHSETTETPEVITEFGIPGEGSCLVDGITYPNTSIIESSNPCHSKCVCLSSIPTCTLVTCSPPPNDPKCMPIQLKPESCCPVYVCEGNEQLHPVLPSHNQIISDHSANDKIDVSSETGTYPSSSFPAASSSSETNIIEDSPSTTSASSLHEKEISPEGETTEVDLKHQSPDSPLTTEVNSKPSDQVPVTELSAKPQDDLSLTEASIDDTHNELPIIESNIKIQNNVSVTELNVKPQDEVSETDLNSKPPDDIFVSEPPNFKPQDDVTATDQSSLSQEGLPATESSSKPQADLFLTEQNSKPQKDVIVTELNSKPEEEMFVTEPNTKPQDDVITTEVSSATEVPVESISKPVSDQNGVNNEVYAATSTVPAVPAETTILSQTNVSEFSSNSSPPRYTTIVPLFNDSIEFPTESSGSQIISENSDSVSSQSQPNVVSSSLFTVKEGTSTEIELSDSTISSVPNDTNEMPFEISEPIQNGIIGSTRPPLIPTKITVDEQTDAQPTEHVGITSESVTWDESTHQNDNVSHAQTNLPTFSTHITHQSQVETTTRSYILPNNENGVLNTDQPTYAIPAETSPSEDQFDTVIPEELPQTTKTNKPTTLESSYVTTLKTHVEETAETTVNSIIEYSSESFTSDSNEVPQSFSPVENISNSSSPLSWYPTTVFTEEPVRISDKITTEHTIVYEVPSSTIAPSSETTVVPESETTRPEEVINTNINGSSSSPSSIEIPDQSNEIGPTDIISHSNKLTTVYVDHSPAITTITENVYSSEVSSNVFSTAASSAITDYAHLQTTLPPVSNVAEVNPEIITLPSTSVPVQQEIYTNKFNETNEAYSPSDTIITQQSSSGSSASVVSLETQTELYTTTVEVKFSNTTEKQAPISINTDTSTENSYSPIQQSTWTRKPIEEEVTHEANYYPHPPSYPTGSTDNNGVNSSPDGAPTDEYEDDVFVSGSGTCRYAGKTYVSAQQIPRDDPCDFCFCFRSDIICLQQSCPPPIHGCRQEPIQGFCCPRYECPVARDISLNLNSTSTTTTTTTTTILPTRPSRFPLGSHRGSMRKTGCVIHGYFYNVGDDIAIASGPCLECICGSDGRMKCDPKTCSPEPYVQQMMDEAAFRR